jgi:vacuolar protein sorting-associated protein VTA1
MHYRQTADTFQAGATFLDLLQIWPPVDPEVSIKTKFAKYHALRIAKAIKAGEDPNLSNPEPEPSPVQEAAPLDPDDPEVQALQELGQDAAPSTGQQPSIEDVPDEHDRISDPRVRTSGLDGSHHSSRASSVPRPGRSAPPSAAETFYTSAGNGEVSPLGPESPTAPSVGGGYFPRVSDDQYPDPPVLPQAPEDVPGASPTFSDPPSAALPKTPNNLSYQPPPPLSSQSNLVPSVPQYPPGSVDAHHDQPSVPQPPSIQPQYQNSATPSGPPSAPQPNFAIDDDAIAKAQKHARWAISALNFEDVATAVSELESALRTLGAR